MANELSTAGIGLKYAVETTAGTKPSSFTAVPNVKTIGEFNPEPSTLEVTDLSDLEWKRYIPGLKDPGGAIPFTVNFTKAFLTAWAAAVTAAETGFAAGKATWWQVNVPNVGTFEFQGMPSDAGLPSVETDSVFEGDVYVVPNGITGWTLSE